MSVTERRHCVSSLGTKLTDDFDVAFYVKGDKKPLKVYDVSINLEYDPVPVAPPVPTDSGDAPATYEDVTKVVGDTYLGTSPTVDDGVFLPADGLVAGTDVPVDVDVTGTGTLDAYIDFNADGDFLDDGEQVATDTPAGTVAEPRSTRLRSQSRRGRLPAVIAPRH